MNTSLASTSDEPARRRLSPSPGVVVVVLGVLLVAAILVGVMVNNRGEGEARVANVTIAELRADPDRFDNQQVTLFGTVEDVRELPYLSQYAVYTLRDDTGTLLVLTQKGAPPSSVDGQFRVTGIYHSKVTLDDELRRIAEDKLGSVAGSLVGMLLPGVPLNVVFLEHQRYAPVTP